MKRKDLINFCCWLNRPLRNIPTQGRVSKAKNKQIKSRLIATCWQSKNINFGYMIKMTINMVLFIGRWYCQERRTIGSRTFEDQAKRMTQRSSKFYHSQLEAEMRFQTNSEVILVQQVGKAGFISFYMSLQEHCWNPKSLNKCVIIKCEAWNGFRRLLR